MRDRDRRGARADAKRLEDFTDAVHEVPGSGGWPLQPSDHMPKSPGFVPPTVSDEITSGPVPVLVIFTDPEPRWRDSAADQNPIDGSVTLIAGVVTIPVP